MIPILPLAGVISGITSLAQTCLGKSVPARPFPQPLSVEFPQYLDARPVRFQATGFELEQMGLEAQKAVFQIQIGRSVEAQDVNGNFISGRLQSVRLEPEGMVLQVGGQRLPLSQIRAMKILN